MSLQTTKVRLRLGKVGKFIPVAVLSKGARVEDPEQRTERWQRRVQIIGEWATRRYNWSNELVDDLRKAAGDEQWLFDPKLLKLDGWTRTEKDAWRAPNGSEGQPPAPVEGAPDRSRRTPPGSPHRDRPPRPPAYRSTRTTRHPGAPLCPRPEDPRGSRREPSSDTATSTYRPTPSMDRLWRRRRRRDVLRRFAFGDQTVLRRTPRRPPPAGPLPPAISPHRAVPLARPPRSPGASGTPNTSRSTRSRRAPADSGSCRAGRGQAPPFRAAGSWPLSATARPRRRVRRGRPQMR